ncbi:prepilin-type N-terminal cleavage/methylation domain-containing protein [Diaphorobacter aerolatus]|uniref:Prepilin-type N-terminal cleavage/methylation domain-containing protein n=1 Tax=Diaphorobacter aerolatus TaxID=1288495 RepID=A0A7H0GNU9_9BURK|nr:prepilin-type N-terminal cleavage/methylation domain-containing protein [Diaphorobacter aerolatus]QNP49965.1 prepilin-type N-terminal cleavage/methylation domain-containing protein [Diaphorobacter aerolatus]
MTAPTRQQPATRPCAREPRGFTLVEMLVVMVLLSTIMLALVSGMRSAGQSSDRVDAHLAMQDEERLAERFVRSTLGRPSARPVVGAGINAPLPQLGSAPSSGRPPPLFLGGPDQVSWVGVLPARYGAGGRSFFHLGVEPVEGSNALVLRYLPWDDQANFPDWGAASSQVLMQGVAAASFQYENDRPLNMDANTEWEGTWAHPGYLPARISIDIQREARAPLQWVVPLWPLPGSLPGGADGDDEVIGGS